MPRIVSFPGESASSERDVVAPYTSAAPAATSARMTPYWVRKSLKDGSLRSLVRAASGATRTVRRRPDLRGPLPAPERAGVYRSSEARVQRPGTQRRPLDSAG